MIICWNGHLLLRLLVTPVYTECGKLVDDLKAAKVRPPLELTCDTCRHEWGIGKVYAKRRDGMVYLHRVNDHSPVTEVAEENLREYLKATGLMLVEI